MDKRPPQPRGAHLPPYREPLAEPPAKAPSLDPSRATGGRSPRKLTVTRVAALRSRELTHRGVQLFQRATTADGADRSGLAHLTYAVMANYAVDAALMVALANTIFFADTGSPGKVLAYLAITVAPFAVVAPFIGPALDRLQQGRRMALAISSWGRALLAVLMAFNFEPFNPWVIYPCALGNLVLSKAFSVLKAALTPRVLPEQITLVKTNSRLTVFGLIAGGVAGGLAAGILALTGSPGALIFTALCAVGGGILCLRIPAWVESTEGEVPVKAVGHSRTKRSLPPPVVATLWANSTIRIETGFLALFIAFVVKNQYEHLSAFTQLLLLGIVGGAAGLGGFVGNALGARLNLSAPELISNISLAATSLATLVAAMIPGLLTATIVGLVGSTASSLAKVCLDSVIQHHLPEESRASAFGKTESVLQIAWVFGGVVGLLIGGVWFGHVAGVYSIGFGVVTALLVMGIAQCLMMRKGRTLVPAIRRTPKPSGASRKKPAAGTTTPMGPLPTTPDVHGAPPVNPAPPPGRAPSAAPRKAGRRPRKAGTDR
ncbi:MFS transporter [Nakamurella sp. YIM 132087]|uniref:MFS transporter n=2 Tax=Nakamurella alba TaxID=2665158 RepID=A0A7K1FS68_9ACTN|nr:MFS transporter [Nakamurella alba]